jgi:hypothetical protein
MEKNDEIITPKKAMTAQAYENRQTATMMRISRKSFIT